MHMFMYCVHSFYIHSMYCTYTIYHYYCQRYFSYVYSTFCHTNPNQHSLTKMMIFSSNSLPLLWLPKTQPVEESHHSFPLILRHFPSLPVAYFTHPLPLSHFPSLSLPIFTLIYLLLPFSSSFI